MKKVFAILKENERSKLKYVHLKRNETLFKEDDICECIGLVMLGNITISSFSYQGKEIVFNSLHEGEMFGNNLLFSSDPHFKGDVIAKTETVIAIINKDLLLELMQNNVEFLKLYLKYSSNFSIELNTKIKLLSFEKSEDRLLYFLYINHNYYRYRSITDLANKLFLNRETTSRLCTRLYKENKIILNRKNKTIKAIG